MSLLGVAMAAFEHFTQNNAQTQKAPELDTHHLFGYRRRSSRYPMLPPVRPMTNKWTGTCRQEKCEVGSLKGEMGRLKGKADQRGERMGRW